MLNFVSFGISKTVMKVYILLKSHNIREKIKYILYSKQENQNEAVGRGGRG